jgi:hypothetical protein
MEWHGIKIVLPVQINNKGDMSQAFSDVNIKKTFLCEKTFTNVKNVLENFASKDKCRNKTYFLHYLLI